MNKYIVKINSGSINISYEVEADNNFVAKFKALKLFTKEYNFNFSSKDFHIKSESAN